MSLKEIFAHVQAEVEAEAKKAADTAYEAARAEYESGDRSWIYDRKTFADGFIAGYLAAEFRT